MTVYVSGVSLCVQCYLGGTVLHLCDTVGPRAVHSVWHLVCRLHHPAQRHGLRCRCTDILPAVRGGLQMVVAFHLQCRVSQSHISPADMIFKQNFT